MGHGRAARHPALFAARVLNCGRVWNIVRLFTATLFLFQAGAQSVAQSPTPGGWALAGDGLMSDTKSLGRGLMISVGTFMVLFERMNVGAAFALEKVDF